MKKMILFRFGQGPNPAVSQVLNQHMAGKGELLPIPGAIISFFHTESDLELIDTQLKKLDQVIYILTDITETPYSITLPGGVGENLKKFLSKHGQAQPVTLQYLRDKLDRAIEAEDFETAAIFRVKIKTFGNS